MVTDPFVIPAVEVICFLPQIFCKRKLKKLAPKREWTWQEFDGASDLISPTYSCHNKNNLMENPFQIYESCTYPFITKPPLGASDEVQLGAFLHDIGHLILRGFR